jgi:N-carbamoyl-L-amino-acid hydrolase
VTLAGYLELHIEQGPVLERDGIDIGIVTGITGASSFLVAFEGDARHAGTTPMDARRDAALGAAAFTIAVRDIVVRDFPGCVATVGDIATEPGSFNVVPGGATLKMECRALDLVTLDGLGRALLARADEVAATSGLDVTVAHVGRAEPSRTDGGVRAVLAQAAAALGLTAVELPSGAGHDARPLAWITPSGMAFVPSAGGISHDPTEHTAWADCVNGANVLLNAALALAHAAVG